MRFDRKVTLHRPKFIDDDLGGKKPDGFSDLGSARAAFVPAAIGEELKAGNYGAKQGAEFVVRWSQRLHDVKRNDVIKSPRDGDWIVLGSVEVGRRLIRYTVKRDGG